VVARIGDAVGYRLEFDPVVVESIAVFESEEPEKDKE
jgi:hypothetical protein